MVFAFFAVHLAIRFSAWQELMQFGPDAKRFGTQVLALRILKTAVCTSISVVQDHTSHIHHVNSCNVISCPSYSCSDRGLVKRQWAAAPRLQPRVVFGNKTRFVKAQIRWFVSSSFFFHLLSSYFIFFPCFPCCPYNWGNLQPCSNGSRRHSMRWRTTRRTLDDGTFWQSVVKWFGPKG